jgi:hypothetical protein|tara:strand:+ start:579 stop:1109 length:531 start_codon:yes stop_codon:yes gene_type:complete
MAYITKENTKAIREELKKEFPNTDFSVKINAGHSGVIVTVNSKRKPDNIKNDCKFWGLITDFETMGRLRENAVYRFTEQESDKFTQRQYMFNIIKEDQPELINERIDLGKGIYDISMTEEQIKFFNKVHDISRYAPVKAGQIDKWADNSDIMTDYFEVTYYVTVKFLRPEIERIVV